MSSCHKLPHVLLVEDDAGDAELTERAFQEADLPAIFTHAPDGEEAIERCRSALSGWYPYPDLIILDLKLPGTDGPQVLRYLREHERFNGIPVVIFTGEASDADRERCAELHPDDWVLKPGSLRELISCVHEWRELMDEHCFDPALDSERFEKDSDPG